MILRRSVSVPVRMLLAFFAISPLFLQFAVGEKPQKQQEPEQKPSLRIPVAPLGYLAPSSFYLTARLSSISLDFIDNNHLLFTFHLPGLMKRLPDDLPSDEDQMIRALVLELPNGKVTAKADWRMHDRSRYLWRLNDGHFLVRQRSSLFLTDASLKLQPYVQSEGALESVQLSPDRKLMVMEAQKDEHTKLASTAGDLGDVAPDTKPVEIYILRTETRQIIAHAKVLDAVEVPMMDEGHLLAIASRQNQWLIRYVPFQGKERTLTTVESTCHPSEEPVSRNVTLVMACPRSGDDHLVSAVNADGKTLWQQRWESRYIWPTFQLTQNGSRFAYSSLQVSHPIGTMDPVDESNIQRQLVGIFDTATGQLKLVEDATPILSAGQNYALSPDGQRFAILRQGAIEVYDLPPAPQVGR